MIIFDFIHVPVYAHGLIIVHRIDLLQSLCLQTTCYLAPGLRHRALLKAPNNILSAHYLQTYYYIGVNQLCIGRIALLSTI
jgi:hypothetical protein